MLLIVLSALNLSALSKVMALAQDRSRAPTDNLTISKNTCSGNDTRIHLINARRNQP